jgi:hypothetical protein
MDFELLVMNYLATQGLFLSPQFSIDNEWSCPDFVALDFLKHEIHVVEVTTAWNITNLISKIQNREVQWFDKLKPQLIELGLPVKNWQNIVRVFVRQDRYDFIKSKFEKMSDVKIEKLEDIAFPWNWSWDYWKTKRRLPVNLPSKKRTSH